MPRPWMKFYPADWRAEPRLRMSSLAARGLWADLMSYMHESVPYGHMTIEGVAPSVEDLAALVSRPLDEVKAALAELEIRKVFSRTEEGVIFSRRMVRDEAKSKRDKENGKAGGNPQLLQGAEGVNPPVKAQIPDARIQKEDDAEAATAVVKLVSAEAMAIADRLLVIAGHPDPNNPPPGWCGAAMRVQAWLNQGWNAVAMEVGARAAMKRKRGTDEVASVQFFQKSIAREHTKLSEPVPTSEYQNGPPKNQPRTSYAASKDNFRETLANFGNDDLPADCGSALGSG